MASGRRKAKREVWRTGPITFGNASLFVLACATFVLAVSLIYLGLWPGRRGTTPHCKRCDYNLTARATDRCSECGAELLPKDVVYGEPRRRWPPLILVIGPVVLCAVLLQRARPRVDWYRIYPISWLVEDLRTRPNPQAQRAHFELQRRIENDSLGTSQYDHLIDAGLAEQATIHPRSRAVMLTLVGHLGPCYVKGKMSKQQEQTFFRQVFVCELRVRPRIASGERLRVETTWEGRTPSPLWLGVDHEHRIFIDGEPVDSKISCVPWGVEVGGRGSSGRSFHYDRPGKHVLSIDVPYKVYRVQRRSEPERVLRTGWGTAPQGSLSLCYEGTMHLEAEFEVLPPAEKSSVKLIQDDSLKPALQSAIRPLSFSLTAQAQAGLASQ